MFCVYNTEEEIKRPPGEKEEGKSPRDSGEGGLVKQDGERDQAWDWFQDWGEQVPSRSLGGEIPDALSISRGGGSECHSGDKTGQATADD